MKITIDTKTDSKDEIKRMIKFLETLVDYQREQDGQEYPSGENVFGNMFGGDMSQSSEPANVPEDGEPEEKDSFSISELQTY